MILKKIYGELMLIRKELQAIRSCTESISEYVTVKKATYPMEISGKGKQIPTFQEVLQASRQYLQE